VAAENPHNFTSRYFRAPRNYKNFSARRRNRTGIEPEIAPKIEPEILASSDRDFKTKFNSHNFSGVTIFHQERESYGTRRVFTFVEYSKIGLAKSHVRHNITLYIKFLHRNILARIYLTVQSHQTRYTQYGHTQQ
jgi:hypothetical protein